MLLLFWALLAASCAPSPSPSVGAEDVVYIDDDLLADGPFALTRGWHARAGIAGALEAAQSPVGWPAVDIRAPFVRQGFPDQGSVSYRLQVRHPQSLGPLHAALQHVNNAHRIWAVLPSGETRLLAESGTVSDRPSEVVLSRRPVVFALPDAPAYTLIWQVSNNGYPRGGTFFPLYVGTRAQIEQSVLWRVTVVVGLTGLFLALGVAALLMWLQNIAEPPGLALSMLCLLAAMRTLAQSGLMEYLTDTSFDTRILVEMFTALALPGATAFLLWTSMPWAFAPLRSLWGAPLSAVPMPHGSSHRAFRPLAPFLRRVNTVAIALALAMSLASTTAVLLVSTPSLGMLLLPSSLVFSLLLAVMLLLTVEVVYVRHPLAPFFAVAFGGLAAAGLHDLLVAMSLVEHRVYLLSYAYAAFFVFFCTGYVTMRLRAARHAVDVNTELQQRVEARSLELQEASKAAQSAYLAKSQFVAAVSHELRTPLASMMGYAHLLDEEIGSTLHPQHREFLHTIESSGDRLLHLINDLLDLSRIEAGRFDLNLTSVPANGAAREVCRQLYPLAHEKQLDLDVATTLDDEALVTADTVRLRQVLINLLSNAIKFTEKGSVRVHVARSTLRGHPAVAFSVHDTGVGISPGFLPYLFDRFSQEAQAYAQTQQGTGLGLYLARELVVRMNGTITAESTPGCGSVFTVLLPLVSAVPPRDAAPVPASLSPYRV